MNIESQQHKSALFHSEHEPGKLLLLPNIWDVYSAKLVASAGFTSLATASVSLSAIHNYQDGEHIPFSLLVYAVKQITSAVALPLTVDMEHGFSSTLSELQDNIIQLLDAGAIGINIEDHVPGTTDIESVEAQCRRIETIRNTSVKYGVNLFINARTDLYHIQHNPHIIKQLIERAKAFQSAGASGFYPILMNSYNELKSVTEATDLPLNVLLVKEVADLQMLRKCGVRRVSLGPGLFKYLTSKAVSVLNDLKQFNTSTFFNEPTLSQEFFKNLIGKNG
jgi:PEP phosphonomutase and related enzymes